MHDLQVVHAAHVLRAVLSFPEEFAADDTSERSARLMKMLR